MLKVCIALRSCCARSKIFRTASSRGEGGLPPGLSVPLFIKAYPAAHLAALPITRLALRRCVACRSPLPYLLRTWHSCCHRSEGHQGLTTSKPAALLGWCSSRRQT